MSKGGGGGRGGTKAILNVVVFKIPICQCPNFTIFFLNCVLPAVFKSLVGFSNVISLPAVKGIVPVERGGRISLTVLIRLKR